MKIAVVGLGYVGMSLAVLLAAHHEVWAVDVLPEKIEAIKNDQSPACDDELKRVLPLVRDNLTETTNAGSAYHGAKYVIVAVPTSLDPENGALNTSIVESIAEEALASNPDCIPVIKSTVSIGFTEALQKRLGTKRILFSPEFLREGHALHDNLFPSRIVVGYTSGDTKVEEAAHCFGKMLQTEAKSEAAPLCFCSTSEAEAAKLFSNTYLAMRVAFFNELDTLAAVRGMDTRKIIDCVCLDPRIQNYYNNPSFGYGGYCLPKDTKQLMANYGDIPETLMRAIVSSNDIRKNFIAEQVIARRPQKVGIYRLTMKTGSDNFRSSSILDILHKIGKAGIPLLIFEPSIDESKFDGIPIEKDLERFKEACDLILANRLSQDLMDVRQKVFTRDVYSRD